MDTKLEIHNDTNTPPDGWRFTVPETGFQLRAWTAKILAGKVMQHMEANDLPVPVPWWPHFQDAVCRQMRLGEPFCGPVLPKQVTEFAHINLSMAARFIRTIIQVVKDRKFVPLQEANRRLAICAACPMAITIGGCRVCYEAFRKIENMTKNMPLPPLPAKEFCGACGCVIRYKALIDNDTLDKAEKGNRPLYSKECWRITNT